MTCYTLLSFKALAENKVLSEKGVKFARQIAANLESKGFGLLSCEGTQFFFNINTEELLKRLIELGITKEVSSI